MGKTGKWPEVEYSHQVGGAAQEEGAVAGRRTRTYSPTRSGATPPTAWSAASTSTSGCRGIVRLRRLRGRLRHRRLVQRGRRVAAARPPRRGCCCACSGQRRRRMVSFRRSWVQPANLGSGLAEFYHKSRTSWSSYSRLELYLSAGKPGNRPGIAGQECYCLIISYEAFEMNASFPVPLKFGIGRYVQCKFGSLCDLR